MTETRRCIVIPAIKKNAVIPDQLVKRLAGVTLIQRAIDTARSVVPAHDVVVVTDSQEISLICERNGVRVHYNAGLRFTSLDIITEMKSILRELGNDYGHIIVYRASCPLLTWVDIDDAYKTFLENEADCLVTVKSVRHRIWEVLHVRRRIRAGGREQGPHHRQKRRAGRRYHPTYGTVFPQ